MSAQPAPDEMLEGLLAEATSGVTVVPASPSTATDASRQWPSASSPPAIQKVAYNHEAMIDVILANPAVSQGQIARHFGLTESWVSRIMVSDTFQVAYAKRRETMVDPALRITVEDNFKALVSRSLDILQEKLNKPAKEIPDNLVIRALEIGSRAAGYGVRDPGDHPPQTPAQVHIHLEQIGNGLITLLQRKKQEVDVTPIELITADSKEA